MERLFIAEVHTDLIEARETTTEVDTEAKRKKLLDAYAEELFVKREWKDIAL